MSRAFCYQCRRAKVSCLCKRIEKQANTIHIIVLQHPDEVKNPKGSAIIAKLGLQQYQSFVGEDFSRQTQLLDIISDCPNQVAVMFPQADAVMLHRQGSEHSRLKLRYLIVIDATWRKANKIWQKNSFLHQLKCLQLDNEQNSNYRIRKIPKPGYLSSLECIVESLRRLENKPQAYQPLLELFTDMIDFQINKMGEAVYSRNYAKKPKT